MHGLPSSPYGMENGPVALPGINDQPGQRFGGQQPEPIVLDEEPASPAPQAGVQSGWRVKNHKGEVVATMPTNPKAGQDYQRFQVRSIGDTLIGQAVTPEEKQAAMRATAYGESLVGTMSVDNIQKEIVHRYDTDTGYAEKRALQGMRSKANLGGKGGVPAGPTKADKWEQKLDGELRSSVDGIIESERKDSKHAALAQLDNDVAEMENLISAPGAMGQRVAVQKALLALTGKASRESEQAALTGAAGMFTQLQNKLALWTSDDPKLAANYIREFKSMLATQRKYVTSQRQEMGKRAAQRAYAESFGYPDEQRRLAYDIVNGALSGTYGGRAAFTPESGSATPAPRTPQAPAAGGGFDPDL
jgi:hypothetical protein